MCIRDSLCAGTIAGCKIEQSEALESRRVSGLHIERIAELGDRPVPNILGIRARKPAGQRRENPLWVPGVDGGGDASGGDVVHVAGDAHLG